MPILFDKAVTYDAQIEELLVYLQDAIPATASIAVNREDRQFAEKWLQQISQTTFQGIC